MSVENNYNYNVREPVSGIEILILVMTIVLVIIGFQIYNNQQKLKNETPFFTIKSSGEKFQNYPFSDKKCMDGVVYLVGTGKSTTYTSMIDSSGKPLTCI